MELNRKTIIKDQGLWVILLLLCFIGAGLYIVYGSVCSKGLLNGIKNVILVAVFFILFPLALMIQQINIRIAIKNGNITIVEDTVIDKIIRVSSENSQSYMIFKDYRGRGIPVLGTTFKSTQIGDKCYLVFVPNSSVPVGVYNKKEYSLSPELKGKRSLN